MNENVKEEEKPEEEIKPEDKQEVVSEHKGAILKREREAQGVLLETVHEATKIPLDALRAIEENYKIRTLSDFYYKSFLKIYAKYLDVDVAQFIEESKKNVKPKRVEKEEKINFDILDKINSKLTKERKQKILIGLVVLFSLWIFVKFVGFLFSLKPKVKQAKVETVAQNASINTRQSADSSRQATNVVAPSPVTSSPPEVEINKPLNPSSNKNVLLTVRAKKESWLRVKADGNVVFQSTLNAGDVETWDADEKIEITGRNISELEFELNGKMIGSLGRASRRAKGLVVTQEGLSVTK